MDKNEQAARKLDEEFRLGLVSIRPFIQGLTSVEEAHLCRLWLIRLRDSVDERILRNKLLSDLTDQVKSGCLRYPFTFPPTDNPLSFIQARCGEYFQGQGDETYSPFTCEGSNLQDTIIGSESHTSRESEFIRIPERRRSEPFTLTRWRLSEEKEVQPPLEANEIVSEDNDHIQSLLNTIASLKAQNEALKHEVRLYQKTSQKTQQSLNSVNEEVIALRAKLSELQRINANIEKSYTTRITQSLGLVFDKLKEMNQTNADFVSSITRLESMITQGGQNTEEMKLKNEIDELKYELTNEKKKSELEMKQLKAIIDEKNEQLKRVDLQVKKQCNRMQEEVSNIRSEITQAASEENSQLKAKIKSLKKDISRLENANKRLVAEYESRLQAHTLKKGHPYDQRQKLSHLRKEGELNLELTVIELEQRYRKIVSDLEARAALQRKHDAQRIHDLEEQLNHRKDITNNYKQVAKSN